MKGYKPLLSATFTFLVDGKAHVAGVIDDRTEKVTNNKVATSGHPDLGKDVFHVTAEIHSDHRGTGRLETTDKCADGRRLVYRLNANRADVTPSKADRDKAVSMVKAGLVGVKAVATDAPATDAPAKVAAPAKAPKAPKGAFSVKAALAAFDKANPPK